MIRVHDGDSSPPRETTAGGKVGWWTETPRLHKTPAVLAGVFVLWKVASTGVEDARRRLRTHSPDRRQLALHLGVRLLASRLTNRQDFQQQIDEKSDVKGDQE